MGVKSKTSDKLLAVDTQSQGQMSSSLTSALHCLGANRMLGTHLTSLKANPLGRQGAVLLLLPCTTLRVLPWALASLDFADLDRRMLLLCLFLSLAPGAWVVLSTLK